MLLLSFDGTMEQGKQDDKENRREGRRARVSEDVRGSIDWYGATCLYSYHVVYTQESVWVLDLRLVPAESDLLGHLRGILRARCRREGYEDDAIYLE